jgi:alpha-beta hydrolase superfamily lysophospholipase
MVVPAYKLLLARAADPLLPWLPVPSGLQREWMTSDEAMLRESAADPLVVETATPRWYLGCLRVQAGLLSHAPQFRHPLLVLMGEADPTADPRGAHDFFEQAGSEDKTFRLYPNMLHELLRETGRELIFGHILEWLRERCEDGTEPGGPAGRAGD